jgi:hypothetical protein
VEVRAEEITQRLMRALDRANKAKQTANCLFTPSPQYPQYEYRSIAGT